MSAREQAVEAMATALETMVPWDRFDVMVVKSQMETALDALTPPLLSRLFMETANTGCVHRYLPGQSACQCGASEWTGS